MGTELSGKVAVVTGGASGIGRATVELFAEQGAAVVVADVDEDQGAALAAGLGEAVAFRRTDVSDADEIQALVDFAVETYGGLHVMVNNAGIPSSARRFLRDDLRDFDRVMAVNLFGVVVGTQRAGRHMAEHGGGSIINTSSMGGLTGGGPPIVYRMSKASIVNFSRMVATDLAEFGIRVNCIAPGHIPTGITNYDLGAIIERDQPLQRRGTARDVAEAVLFLAGDRSAQITGIVVPVDGGTVAGRPVRQVLLDQIARQGRRHRLTVGPGPGWVSCR